jgi:DNA invertase Pin-like site-specific DNA recombinase
MRPSEAEFDEYNDKALSERYLCSVRTIQRWRRKASVKRVGWGPCKLDMEKAREIRHLYDYKKMTQSALAVLYGVSQAAIGRIINNITYVESNVGFSGSSHCIVEYCVD